jgi:adenylate kinase
MQKNVIIFYGPPGAGKGTQAERAATDYNLLHFDTGKFVEKLINDPKLQKNKTVMRQKKLFLSGKLADATWVGREVKKWIRATAKRGKSIVMSGSPRTEEEAFYLKGGGVADILVESYGLQNILIVFLEVSVSESVKRNSKRGRPGLDEPEIIKIRCREYAKHTLPVIREMKKRGIKMVKIDGMPSKNLVEKAVDKEIKKFIKCQNSNRKKTSRRLKSRDAS